MNAGPVPWLPAGVTSLASSLYRREILRRNRRYDRGEGVTRLDIPIISIGNLSVGGTGKTPLVEHIARTLADAGARPAIALRGYRSANGMSDEAREYQLALPEVLTLVNPDRISAIRDAQHFLKRQGQPPLTSIILDDGFQHRRLARDLDIVLIDATRSPFTDHLLPRGWLREPVESLSRAHAVVITRADLAPAEATAISIDVSRIAPQVTVATAAHHWPALDVTSPSGDTRESVDWIRGKRLLAVCAIGNPEAFMKQISGLAGSPPARSITLRDHDPYAPGTIDAILAAARDIHAEAIVTTRKDWTKLICGQSASVPWQLPIVRPIVELSWLSNGAEILRHITDAAAQPAPAPAPARSPI